MYALASEAKAGEIIQTQISIRKSGQSYSHTPIFFLFAIPFVVNFVLNVNHPSLLYISSFIDFLPPWCNPIPSLLPSVYTDRRMRSKKAKKT